MNGFIRKHNKLYKKFKMVDVHKLYVINAEFDNIASFFFFIDYNYGCHLSKTVFQTIKAMSDSEYVIQVSVNKYILVGKFPEKIAYSYLDRNDFLEDRIKNLESLFKNKYTNRNDITIVWGGACNGIKHEANHLKNLVQLAEYTTSLAKAEKKDYLVADESIRSQKVDMDDFTLTFDRNFDVDEFTPYFQPIISRDCKKIIGCESLVRWQKDTYRLITAEKFKSIALEKNFFDNIDKSVILKSFSAYKSWRDSGLIQEDFILAINMSYHTLKKIDIEDIVFLANVYNVKTTSVEFDFDNLLHDDKAIYLKISELQNNGFRIAIDAFRSDRLSLKPFMHFDVNTIKVDHSWLMKDNNSFRHTNLYKAILFMAKNINAKTLIKGIETKDQLLYSQKLSFDYLQGYYFTKPVDKATFEVFLKKYQDDNSSYQNAFSEAENRQDIYAVT